MAVVVSRNVLLYAEDSGATTPTLLLQVSVPKGTKEVIRGITVAAQGESFIELVISEDGGDTWQNKLKFLLPAEGTLDLHFTVPLEIEGRSNFTPGEGETVLTLWELGYVQPAAQPIHATVYLTRFTYA